MQPASEHDDRSASGRRLRASNAPELPAPRAHAQSLGVALRQLVVVVWHRPDGSPSVVLGAVALLLAGVLPFLVSLLIHADLPRDAFLTESPLFGNLFWALQIGALVVVTLHMRVLPRGRAFVGGVLHCGAAWSGLLFLWQGVQFGVRGSQEFGLLSALAGLAGICAYLVARGTTRALAASPEKARLQAAGFVAALLLPLWVAGVVHLRIAWATTRIVKLDVDAESAATSIRRLLWLPGTNADELLDARRGAIDPERQARLEALCRIAVGQQGLDEYDDRRCPWR